MRGAKPPTMADIARLAGVSASTVSRALAGFPRIPEETRQRIARAAREAGYAPNRHARSLRLKRSGVMLVLIPDLANPNFPDLLMHIDRAAHDCGYDIMIAHTGVDMHRSDRYVDELLAGGIDGVLLTADHWPPRLAERVAAGARLPIVRTLSPTEPDAGIAGIQIDERQAARDVVSHLADVGCRRIAHAGGPVGEPVAIARREGWRTALADRGLRHEGLYLQGGFRMEDGERVAARVLGMDPRPDAVFCTNDESAYGLVATLKANGLRVPEDVAVAGFDDLGFSAVFDPPLTTVRLPRQAMAAAAVARLKRLIEGDREAPIEILPHELVLRRSSQRAASGAVVKPSRLSY